MSQKLTGPALIAYLRASPTSDASQWAADYIESLTGIIEHQAKLNESAHAEIGVLRAAVSRQVANIERWQETGVPAGPEESKSIYEQLKAALETTP